MALEKQLKLDMSGTTDSEKYAHPETVRVCQMKKETITEQNDKAEERVPLHDNVAILLQSVENQINSINQNMIDLKTEIDLCKTSIHSIADKQDRNDRQLTQTLRENANFQIQVRQGMQHDIDILKERQSGEIFNPLLREIAAIYVDYQALLKDDTISGLAKNNVYALFEQLEGILIENGAEIIRSKAGTFRQARISKVINKIPTGNLEKHNTIVKSRTPGVVRERTVLYSEFVDVYIFDPELAQKGDEIENLSEESEVEKELEGQVFNPEEN